MAQKYLKLSRKLEGTRHAEHFQEVHRLVQEANLAKSLPSLLCDAAVPLKLQDWKEKAEFWRQLSEKTKQFQASQSLLDQLDNSQVHGNGLALTGQKVFHDVIALCGDNDNYLHKILAHLEILYSIVPDGTLLHLSCISYIICCILTKQLIFR